MHKASTTIFSIILLLLFLKGFSTALSSNFGLYGIIIFAACMLPVFFIVCITKQKWWLGILIGGAAWSRTVPFVFINGFEIGFLINIIICGLSLIYLAQKKIFWLSAVNSWQSKLMFSIAVWLLFRVLIERPGSVHTGGVGGAKEAYTFLFAGIVFFLPKFLFDMKPSMTVTKRVVLNMALWAFLLHLIISFSAGINNVIMYLFNRPLWFLSAYMLALVAERTWKFGVSDFRNWITIGSIFLLGALSANRSRIIFAAAIVFSVSYLYNRMTKNIALLLVFGIITAMTLSITGVELPAQVSRTLSVVFPSHTSKASEYIRMNKLSNEVGWSSDFRVVLLKMAGRNIKRHPFMGKGFKFSENDYWVPHDKRNTMDAEFQVLATTGGYHNSIVELAVAYGLPVTFIFCIAYIGILIPFVRQLRVETSSDIRILFIGILGLFIAESGQLLMNGFARDYYVISLLLGVMHYSKSVMTVQSVLGGENKENSDGDKVNAGIPRLNEA